MRLTQLPTHEPLTEPVAEPEMLRLYLSARDVECPGCGYNLKGLVAGACPECNEPLVLRVGLAEPRAGAFISGLVGLACGAGGFGLMLAWVIVMTLLHGPAPEASIYVVPLVGVVVLAPALMVWIGPWGRRRVRSLSDAGRVWAAAACWGLTLAIFGLAIGAFWNG